MTSIIIRQTGKRKSSLGSKSHLGASGHSSASDPKPINLIDFLGDFVGIVDGDATDYSMKTGTKYAEMLVKEASPGLR